MEEKRALLEVKDLHTYFYTDRGIVTSVDGVSFSMEENITLGIVGESGSGKSVTALSIMDLLEGTTGKIVKGEILLEGQDLLKLPKDKRRLLRGKDLSMIFQEPMTSLNPVMTIGEQIAENLTVHNMANKKQAKEMAIEMLTKVSIPRPEKIFDSYPFQLSGGMRQRAMIAMALICRPKILIADEPTTALDVTIQAQILELMKRLKEKVGSSIIFITHDLSVVAEICQQVVVMYCGRVVESADVYSLFDKPMHPYTKGLLASIPKIHSEQKRLSSIRGSVPSPFDMPKGCKFAPRCDFKMDICEEKEPGLETFEGKHQCRCWLYAKEQTHG